MNAEGDQHARLEELATHLSIEIDKTTSNKTASKKTTSIGKKLRSWLWKK
jgi:hypothetical protein